MIFVYCNGNKVRARPIGDGSAWCFGCGQRIKVVWPLDLESKKEAA